MLKPWKYDVNVLLIFFVRDDVFAKTFEAVKKARPRRLLLYQDGPREDHPNDIDGIIRCREIAENIDWDCEVYKNYQTKNFGCDPATFYSHKWAFSIVDKCIIIEDDVVVSESFFPFCEELLKKYENDERINRICGMNNIGIMENCPYDYFFSSTGSVWGWATWKRVADSWDENYSFLNDDYHMNLLLQNNRYRNYTRYLETCKKHKESGKPHWETIVAYNSLLNSTLNIISKRNFVSNIGITKNATHSPNDINQIPKNLRKIFFMDTYEIDFPLKHPPYVVDNKEYTKKMSKTLGINNNFIKTYRTIESVMLRLKYGNFQSVLKGIKRRLSIK